jgi:transforming growth factor-beta-induced protein
MKPQYLALSLLLVLALAVAACAPTVAPPAAESPAVATEPVAETPAEEAAQPDIVDTAVAAGSFSTLVSALQAADLVGALKGAGPFTVFAPTDEAFAALPEGALDGLLADSAALSDVLLFHVVPGKVMASDVADGLTAETLQGTPVTFAITDGKPTINGANIVSTDIEASNGVIHVIDAVILPQAEAAAMAKDIVDTAIEAGSFSTLVAAVQAAGLVDALKAEGPFTVFAPTDEAFAQVPAETLEALLADPAALGEILTYHVVPGKVMAADLSDGLTAATLQGAPVTFSLTADGAKVNDANIVATDVEASNGVIHVIDAVILPPAEAEGEGEMPEATGDIVDTATAAGSFTTLLAAADAAGLVDALKGEGPLTVFAPTDEAFEKVPAETLQALLADPEALAEVLLYHVVAGKVMAADLSDGLSAETLQGAPIAFSVMADGAKVNDANIVATDIPATNGVIHVIDAVILPPAEGEGAAPAPAGPVSGNIVDTAAAAGSFSTLLAAAEAAGLAETLQGPGPFTIFAPTDEAFAKLPAGTVDSLLADPDALRDILLFHVVSGELTSRDLIRQHRAMSLQGRALTVNQTGRNVTVNEAGVVTPDIQTSNGIIHVIDTVLIPASGSH